jgi:DNA-binding transcriptional ArsR family regulator
MSPIVAPTDIRKSGYPEPRTIRGSDVRKAAELFKVLSHPDRLRLACRIGVGDGVTQKELVDELGWPQSTTARHIAELRRAGLVAAERDGVEVRLRLGSPVGLQLMETVCEWVHSPAPPIEDEPALRVPAAAAATGPRTAARAGHAHGGGVA